jgi:hypothetical protein
MELRIWWTMQVCTQAWEDGLDRFGEPGQAVDAGHQDVVDSALVQVVQHGHVDPRLDPVYAQLTRTNFSGGRYTDPEGTERDFDGNVALACVRQIAHEVRRTLNEQLGHLLGAEHSSDEPLSPFLLAGVGRNDPCPCGSGRKFKRCHGG